MWGRCSGVEGYALMVNDFSAKDSAAEVSEEAPVKKAPRSRRATAKVASPAATEALMTEESVEAPAKKAPAKKAPAKRAPAKKAAAPSVEAPVTNDADASLGIDVAAVAPKTPVRRSRAKAAPVAEPALFESVLEEAVAAPVEAPVKKTRSRRATAPVTAPVAQETVQESAALEVPAAEMAAVDAAAVDAESAPVKRTTRRRSTKKPVVEDVLAVEEALVAEPVVAETSPDTGTLAEETAASGEEAPKASRRRRKSAAPEAAPAVEAVAETTADAAEEALIEAEEVPAEPLFVAPAAGISALFLAPDLSLAVPATPVAAPSSEDDSEQDGEARKGSRRSRNRRNNRPAEAAEETTATEDDDPEEAENDGVTSRRRRRRRRGDQDLELTGGNDEDPPNTVTKVRAPRVPAENPAASNRVTSLRGSTRLEAKKQRRRDSRDSGRRRTVITEAEFLARRESVDRVMVVRQNDERIQIGVLEDGILAEHFVSKTQQDSLIGNVYLGKVQNVLPSMEAAFVDIGRGRNAVLYAGEVDWDAAHLNGQPRRIENALKSGDSVLVQVSKDPVGHKGARLTSQISLPGRYLVYVPGGSMTGISRKLPDVERNRLKRVLKDHLPENAGVIVRTAAEGASEEELTNDINRLRAQWEGISNRATSTKTLAPEMLYAEPDLTIKVVRDVFNEDFSKLVVAGDEAWDTIEAYVTYVAPDLLDRLEKWTKPEDIFGAHRIDEQISKALDRKVFLPSGGSLVIDRTEAMTVVDVNTGKFTGSGGNLEETVTKNNLEAAEEVVRQLRLRDIGGIIVIDFIDMVLESNRDLVLRRLVECLGRDRTKHQVAEVTSLGLIQMTRKRMGTGLLEVFGEQCEVCAGRGMVTHEIPVEHRRVNAVASDSHHAQVAMKTEQRNEERTGANRSTRSERKRNRNNRPQVEVDAPAVVEAPVPVELDPAAEAERAQKAAAARAALSTIAAAAAASHHEHDDEPVHHDDPATEAVEIAALPNSLADIATVTFDGEAIELPRGHQHDAGNSDDAAQRLAGLSQALDQLVEAHEAQEADVVEPAVSGADVAANQPVKAESAAPSGNNRSRARRARRNRSARSAQGPGDTAVESSEERGGSVGATASSNDHVVAAAPVKKAAEPIIMLGVGVPASEL